MRFTTWRKSSKDRIKPPTNISITNRYANQNRSYFEDVHFHDTNEYDWPIESSCLGWCYGKNHTDLLLQRLKYVDNIKHLIIFDWDDTLFFTSFIHHKFDFNKQSMDDRYAFDVKQISIINKCGDLLYKLFSRLIRFYGSQNIKIITSAQSDWPSLCMTFYGNIISNAYCKFYQLLSIHNIEIISARNKYHQNPLIHGIKKTQRQQYIDNIEHDEMLDDDSDDDDQCCSRYDDEDSIKWKRYTFDELLRKYYNKYDVSNMNTIYCIQNIGDSCVEYQVSKNSSDFMDVDNFRYLFRMKLLDEPDLYEFYFQMVRLNQILITKMRMFQNIIPQKQIKKQCFQTIYHRLFYLQWQDVVEIVATKQGVLILVLTMGVLLVLRQLWGL